MDNQDYCNGKKITIIIPVYNEAEVIESVIEDFNEKFIKKRQPGFLTKAKHEIEKVCFNCNQFFPYPLYELTEHGICLNEVVFAPYIDDIFDDNIDSSLNNLMEEKKLHGDKKACENFDPVKLLD